MNHVYQELEISLMKGNEWKTPLNLALGFHIFLGLAIIYLPQLFEMRPRFEDIYTVNLINIAENQPAEQAPETAAETPVEEPKPAPPEPPQPKPVIQAPPKIVEKAIALNEPEIVEPPSIVPETPAPQAISIKPAKTKVKTEPPPQPPPKPKTSAQDISKLQREKLAQMLRAEQKATDEASRLAEEAELERRLAEAVARRAREARERVASAENGNQNRGSSGDSSQLTALELQYFSSVRARIQPFWSLPKFREWDPNLTALIVITIEKDGRIAGNFLEASSGDSVFDRFALKVLDDVGHLPPIPAAIKKNRIELGLKFTPGNIR